jgi:capsule assembly protein Wzi
MFRRVLLGIGVGLLLGRLSAFGAPYDIVPRDDWTYDILARWAAQGVLEKVAARESAGPAVPVTAREFHGDEPLTRAEMADIVLMVAGRPETLPAGDEALLTQLLWEFSGEIKRAGRDPAALIRALTPVKQPVLRPTGFGLGRLGITGGDTLRGVYRAAGVASVTPRLLTAISLTNERQLFSTDADAFPILENYVARWHTGFAEWELGKTARRWGPGFGGTMLLSDNAPALFQLRGLKRLSLGFLGRDYTFEQFVATLNEIGGRRYIVARRLSRPFGRRAGLSIDEAIKSSSTRDGPLALFLPLYVYNHTVFTDAEKARTVNYLGGGDLWYAPSDAVRVYGDLVIDDTTTPFGLGYHVPRKIGYLLGINLPHLNGRRTEVWLEWALTDGEQPGSGVQEGGTYIHRNPTLSWYVNDLPIGHPMGQNRRGPFARVRHRFSRRFTAIGEWEDERQWRPTPIVGNRRRAMLYGAYDLRPDRSIALRVERTGGALGRDTLVEMQGSYSF